MIYERPLALPKAHFPALLHQIPDPPKKMWQVGSGILKDNIVLCVVGSRSYTPYGKEVCEKLIEGLAGQPVTIVSGLALGIDSIAHKAALSVKLQTIAVPGSGLDENVLYPSTNKMLAAKIVESGGGLLSEFEPGYKATTWGFPQRNRIMAGMSKAVLVIEADIKSGTLITSRLASDYNRDVLTVPGSIFGKFSAGPHMLLRLGATLVRSSEDILEALGLEVSKDKIREKVYDDCSSTEKKIIELLQSPRERDDLIRLSGLGASEANTILGVLELKGLIREFMGEVHLTDS